MMRVYHFRHDPKDPARSGKVFMGIEKPEFNEQNFELVAEVDIEDEFMEWAYTMTQHLDEMWWKKPCVKLVGEPMHRSTSVGDVVELSDGCKFRCALTGWEPVSNE